jgi:hypothetical protein
MILVPRFAARGVASRTLRSEKWECALDHGEKVR